MHTLGTLRSDPRPFEPSHQRPGFQAPAGPASGPGLSQARQQLEKGRGWEDWGPGSLLRSRPGPRQWLGRGRRRQQREPLTPHHSPGRLASITRGSGSSAGYPPSKNSSEPQSRPQTGGAAWGGGRGLGPVGARAGQALPLRAAGGQPAEPAHPRPFSVSRTPLPSLFSLLPPFSPPFPSQETARPEAHWADLAWAAHTLAYSQGPGTRCPPAGQSVGATERGRQCSESGATHPGVWLGPPVRGAHPWAQDDAPRGSGCPSLLPASSTAASP